MLTKRVRRVLPCRSATAEWADFFHNNATLDLSGTDRISNALLAAGLAKAGTGAVLTALNLRVDDHRYAIWVDLLHSRA